MQTTKLTPEELYDYLSNVDHSYSSVHEFLCEAIKLRNQDLVDKTIKLFVEHELKMLDKGIVATPNQDYLLQFTEANNGSNDYLLMQMAKNYGYKIALLNMKDRFYE
jgi:hypothetical protein